MGELPSKQAAFYAAASFSIRRFLGFRATLPAPENPSICAGQSPPKR
jgi:hypothetical protein